MSVRFLGIAAATSLLLAVGLTWPVVLEPGAALLGSPDGDAMKHLWNLWWMKTEVVRHSQVPFSTQLVNFPDGLELYPIEPLNGVMVVLLSWLPVVVAANLSAMANLALTGFCAACLGRAVSGSAVGGLVAALILETSAYARFSIHVGAGELQHVWLLPLGLLAWVKLQEDPGARKGALLGLVLGGTVLACLYYGLFLALALSLLSLLGLRSWRTSPGLVKSYVVAAALGLLVVLGIRGRLVSSEVDEVQASEVPFLSYVFSTGLEQEVLDPPEARLDPVELFRRADKRRARVDARVIAYGGGRYLGLPVLLLALVALVSAPRRALPWAAVGVMGIVFATGSYLMFEGEQASWRGSWLAMPMLTLNRALDHALEALHYPARFLGLTITAIAVLGAIATQAVVRGRRLAVPVVGLALISTLDVQAHQLIPGPQPRFDFVRYAGLEALQESPGAVLDLTTAGRMNQRSRPRAIAAQIAHGQPVQAVPLERVETYAVGGRRYVRALPLLKDLDAALARQPIRLAPEAYRGDLALLRSVGFRYVLALADDEDDRVNPVLRDALAGLMGPPVLLTADHVVFEIPEVAVPVRELESWRYQQILRLNQLSSE